METMVMTNERNPRKEKVIGNVTEQKNPSSGVSHRQVRETSTKEKQTRCHRRYFVENSSLRESSDIESRNNHETYPNEIGRGREDM